MRPILFNTQMVQAILEGRKTVTRRVMNPQPKGKPYRMKNSCCWPGYFADSKADSVYQPPYQPGDILYVRETWQFFPCFDCVKSMCDTTPLTYEDSDSVTEGCWIYKADYIESDQKRVCWRPSIHMPKEAARIFLRVKNVWVERLQDITPDQIDAEGFKEYGCSTKTGELIPSWPTWFSIAWDKTVPRNPNKFKRYPFYWKDNPWVWVIEFERISRKEAKNNA